MTEDEERIVREREPDLAKLITERDGPLMAEDLASFRTRELILRMEGRGEWRKPPST